MGIESKLIALIGVAVVGFVGEKILVAAGQPQWAENLKIVITIGGTLWVAKMVYDGMVQVVHTFGAFL